VTTERITRLLNILMLDYQGPQADEYRPKILVINLLSIFIVLMIPVILIFSVVQHATYISTLYFLLGSVGVYALNILIFKRTQKYLWFALGYLVGTLAIGVFFLFVLIRENWVVYWALVYPMLGIYLLGQKRGNWFSFFLLLLVIFVLFYWISPDHTDLFMPLSHKIHILFIYGFLWLMGNIYNWYLNMSLEKVREAKELILKENEKKDRFLTQLSHQIRTPLNDIVAFESLLKKTRIADEDREMFEMIMVSTTNLIQVVDSITETGAFTTPIKQIGYEPFRLSEIFSQLKELAPKQYGNKLHITFPGEEETSLTLQGDRVILKQIIMNVMEGIFRNQQEEQLQTTITLKKEEQGDKILLTLFFRCDRPLFDQKRFLHLTRLADQGVRVLSDPEDFQYINLLLARSLVRQLGGSLELTRFEDGKTPCLKVTVPFRKVKETRSEMTAMPVAGIPAGQKKKLSDAIVLLAEDNPINQKIVKLSLQKYVKQIDIAQDGKEALDLYGTTRYDFILMDIQMPKMDGITVTRKIREIETSTNTHTPIIAITANAMLGDRETCISSGMDEYISKPFQIQTLIRIMEELLK